MAKNVVKAWHFHHQQIDWWYVPIGNVDVALHDLRPQSPTHGETMTFRMGVDRPVVVKIPPGVGHGSMSEWVFIVLAGLVASATSALGINDQLVNKFLLGRGKGRGGT